jgi:L-ascorbate metabolism protein UlaG (beta-lactamase superfamily)
MRITWLGHSAFRLDFGSVAILMDPFLSGNPAFTGDKAEVARGITHILVTHAHSDHVGDTIPLAKETGATVVTNYELAVYLGSQGVEHFEPMNTGGTVDLGPFSVTLVRADHAAGLGDLGVSVPLGNANGIIVKAPGEKTLYHLGDTDIFSDMALIDEIHAPKVGLVPIGDRFTMGPEVAALAVKRFLRFETVLPCHYASFPIIGQSPDAFVEALEGHPVTVLTPRPGGSVEV